MSAVELVVTGRNLLSFDRWPQSCEGSLRYPSHLDCGQCEGVIGRGEVAYAVKGEEARTVYCSLSCAKENGYVDLLN
jgi:hypothetical protein